MALEFQMVIALTSKQPIIASSSETRVKSPLRYPGGKQGLTSFVGELLLQNGLIGKRYYEPFAGGAGVALGLLSQYSVSEVVLNDADYHIYCFWSAVLNRNENFREDIRNISISVREWRRQKEIYLHPKRYSVFEVGFSTFYLNRCNRSGILSGAGPIGGYKQKGPWAINARFNRSVLENRIADIGKLRKRICVKCMDALEFMKTYLPQGSARKRIFIYADPPYVTAGSRLYLNLYLRSDHKRLSQYLVGQNNLQWMVTYDDNRLIRKMYASCQRWLVRLNYSLQSKKQGCELLIAPKYINMPRVEFLEGHRFIVDKKLKRRRGE